MKNIIFILLCISCAAALVPETNSPDVKIKQAMQLIHSNRHPMAEKFCGDALSMYEAAGNKAGMAQAYLAYAEVYKSGVTKNDLKAADSLAKGAEIHHSLEFYLSATMEYWSASHYYADAKQIDRGCQALNDSEKAFKLRAKAKDAHIFGNADGFIVRIQDQREKLKCRTKK